MRNTIGESPTTRTHPYYLAVVCVCVCVKPIAAIDSIVHTHTLTIHNTQQHTTGMYPEFNPLLTVFRV